jgi:hypothetical protein
MPPRKKRNVGDVIVSQNGYSYTYIEGDDGKPIRVATHHLVGLKKYGRKPHADERVIFHDNDRANLSPDNILYVKKTDQLAALRRRRSTVIDKINELQAELDQLEDALVKAGVKL